MRVFTRFRRTVASLLILSMSVGPAFADPFVYQVPLKPESDFPTWAPNLQLSSASHDFGTVVLGGSSATSVELKNMGRQSLEVTAVNTVVPFAHSSNCPKTLYGGASCTVNLVYQPASAGASDAAMSVVSTANSANMELQGQAVTPTTTLALSAAFLSFDASDVGHPAASRPLVITNTGNSPATVTGIGVSTGGTDFRQSNNCASALAPGASCTVNAFLVPTAFGSRTGNLNIYEEASGTLYNVALSGFGNAAVVEASPTAVAFGSPVVGTSADRVVTVRNAGNQTIDGLATALTDAEFKLQSTDCGATLAAGSSCTVNVRFSAQLAGEKSVVLKANTANAGSATVTLTGTAIAQAPKVSAAPADVAFGDVEVGSTAPARAVTLSNTGNTPVTVSGLSVSTGADAYTQTNDCAVLAVGASCAVQVTFKPTARGVVPGTVSYSFAGQSQQVALSGKGIQGVLTLSVSSVDFGQTQRGKAANARTVTVTNSGDSPLIISSAVVPASDFTASSTCATLAAGASCAVSVGFTPSERGLHAQTLTVTTNVAPVSVALQGTGVEGISTVTPSSLLFAVQQVGSTSVPQTVTLTNSGTSPLTVTGVSLVSGGTDFAQTNNCAAVAVNGTCSVSVAFTPTAAGSRTGTLALVDDTGVTSTVSFTGSGQVASATLSAAAFASAPVGTSVTGEATLTNSGIGALSVVVPSAASVTGTDFSFASTSCTNSLAAGASCTVAVRFSPTSTASRSGTLAVSTGAGTQAASLSSTGIQGFATTNPTALSFAAQQTSTTSGAQSVTVSNTGTTTLVISGVSVSGGASDFAQTNNCATLAVGGTCSVNVTFTPAAAGTRTGVLTLAHNGAGASTVGLSGTGQAASATLSTPAFTATAVGASSTAVATLTNTGIGPLSVSVPNASAVSGADFSFSSTTCGSSLAAGATCSVSVAFSPTSTAARAGTLSIGTGAGTQSAGLGSAGIQGYASVNPSALTFGTLQSGTTSGARTITVTNTGTSVLSFTGVGISGGSSDFAQTNNCGSVPVNGTCAVNVAFTPAAAGSRTGSLAFTHNGGGIATVSLSGSGQAPSAALSTPTFSATAVGASSTAAATLTNTGVGSLTVVVPGSSSVSGTDFSFVSTTCSTTLAAGATCSTTVRFSPTSTAARAGTLAIGTGAGTQSAALGSTGLQGYASLSAASLDFGTVQTNTASVVKSVTVTNTGNSPLTVSSAGISSGANDFGQSNNCASIAVNGTCTINVATTPFAAGTRPGTFSLVHNGGGGSTISLSVVGRAPSASLSTPAFAATAVGGNTSATATLTNTGIGPLTITSAIGSSVSGADFSFTSSTCPTTLAASASCAVTVRFAPTVAGTRSGMLSFSTVAGTQSAVLSASGTIGNLSASTTSLAYGSSVKSQSVTLTNTGGAPLTFSSVAISAGGSDFVQSHNCSTLVVNGSCSVTVTFNAAAAGSRTGTLSLAHNGTGVSSVALSGTGASSATLTANTAAQASWYGEGVKVSTVTYRNDGNTAMTLANPAVYAPLSVTSNNCQGVAPGASCTMGIGLTSTAAGAGGSATQNFVPAGASVAPASASMTWTIYSAVPRWSTTYMDLGSVKVGQTSAANVTLYNDGSTAYNWAANSSIANLPAGFSIDTSGCSNVAPWGGACNAVVRFSPGWVGGFGGGSVYVAAASYLGNTLQLAGTGLSAGYNASQFGCTTTTVPNVTARFTYLYNYTGGDLGTTIGTWRVGYPYGATSLPNAAYPTITITLLNGQTVTCSGGFTVTVSP